MKFGVVVFPGSNCDDDTHYVISNVLGQQVEFLWHQSEDLHRADAVILPGGFAFGDYLRIGAIARFSPVMRAVEKFARAGGIVLGICNGFQILLEAGLLPGAMLRNAGLRFRCLPVHIRVEAVDTPFTCAARRGQVLEIPIAHNEGNYFCDAETLAALEGSNQILFRYTTPDGHEDAAANPNGSLANIAGICNRERNVAGLMPHPERASEASLGSADGLVIFKSVAEWFARNGGIARHNGENAAALQAR
ncbi:MAG TPA: phosphoribosylformylglycinamidine synthase subunit PurQ [Candidatus Acidoferrum sp.]|nr:phosphoribosylformylglycinamidine synthase subunit PurQ [Candidatus Acidoferrum sp.]